MYAFTKGLTVLEDWEYNPKNNKSSHFRLLLLFKRKLWLVKTSIKTPIRNETIWYIMKIHRVRALNMQLQMKRLFASHQKV